MSKQIRLLTGLFLVIAVIAISYTTVPAVINKENIFREVTDSTGTTVKIPVHPQRVIILNASNVDMYYGAGGTIIGRPATTAYDEELHHKLAAIPEIGTIHSPNIEKILELNPDLVIGVNVPFHTNLRDTLNAAGIPLIINKLDAYSDVLSTLDFYGELTGNTKAAQQEKERIMAEHDTIVGKASEYTSPRSLIIFGTPGSFNMATSASFSGNLLAELGGNNVADKAPNLYGAFVPLSMEYITKADPEIIFFISMSPNPAIAEAFKEELSKNSLWQGITAVKNQRIYYLSGNLFSVNPGTKIDQALDILYHDLYEPEAE